MGKNVNAVLGNKPLVISAALSGPPLFHTHTQGNTMATGKVKFFTSLNGYGFLTQETGPEVYISESDLPDGVALSKGDCVEFDIEQNERRPGLLRAKNIRLI